MKTVLVHLNVEQPELDLRTPANIADAIVTALACDAEFDALRISAPLAERTDG